MTQTQPKSSAADGVHGAADIAGPDRGGEAVGDVVGEPDRLFGAVDALDGHDGPEDLALDDLGVLGHARHDRRLDEEAVVAARRAAEQHVRAGARGTVEEAEHALLLRGRDDRPHLDRVTVGRVTCL